MIVDYWAIVVAAVAWFLLSKLVASRAKTNEVGKIPVPTCYVATGGPTSGQMEWKIGEREAAGVRFLSLYAVIAVVSLLAPKAPWTLLAVVALCILSVIVCVLLVLELTEDVQYYRETSRQENADGTTDASYHVVFQGYSRQMALIVLGSLLWLPLAWVVRASGLNYWVSSGIIVMGFVIMTYGMYRRAKSEKELRDVLPSEFCERCGRRFKTNQKYGPVETSHLGGDRYAIRNDIVITKTCLLCGNRRVL